MPEGNQTRSSRAADRRSLGSLLPGSGTRTALVVVAHPDDESFGLGAIVSELVAQRVEVRLVCFTLGEASTLGAEPQLSEVRRHELTRAAKVLGVAQVVIAGLPDGQLATVPDHTLDQVVESAIRGGDLVVVFEPNGVTGHPDHRAASAAGVRAADRRGAPVLEWGVAPAVAHRLNEELGTAFTGMDGVDVVVDRTAQRQAILCHASQAADNPVLARRLEVQGDVERVRLRGPSD